MTVAAVRAFAFVCAVSVLSSCTTSKAISERELDKEAKDRSAVSGTLPSDAVRDRATAIALAKNFCRAEISKSTHWRAILDGGVWTVYQLEPGAYPNDELDGAYIKIRKVDGSAISGCTIAITVY